MRLIIIRNATCTRNLPLFEIVIEARTHIQKGDEMYENEA